ncbi:dihydroxyacetone kinase subunit DhaK [Marispirochaeta sp.]|uniref:dihydroxyacetone kinase subunit DhaK n=1 Tax=Marispirochaeta sp. TaxID=2038653 RepID=UPI0029C60BF9|nr:dihydroxyacetone kinase subunit DhaK [Marispirochaeta sp.]
MQKIINDANQTVEDYLEGFVKAHSDFIMATANPRVLKYKDTPLRGKVGVVTGGGSGHKPAFVGYIGKNLVDVVAVGEIFSSPTARAFYDAIREADSGRGVAVLYGNYAGDVMNVRMATEDAEDDGIKVKTVLANDDVPSAPKDQRQKRRGVAGEIFMWKIGGAKAALGGSLDEVIAVAQKAIDNTRSIGIGLSPCTIPAVGKPNFSIKEGWMEVGIGHHGEPGIAVQDLKSAKEIASMCLEEILPDLPFSADDEVAVLISGLGSTPVMELYIYYNEIAMILEERGISVYRPYVGNYFTSLDMTGVTLTIMKLDQELKELLDLDCYSTGLKQISI